MTVHLIEHRDVAMSEHPSHALDWTPCRKEMTCDCMAQVVDAVAGNAGLRGGCGPIPVDARLIERSSQRRAEYQAVVLPYLLILAVLEFLPVLVRV